MRVLIAIAVAGLLLSACGGGGGGGPAVSTTPPPTTPPPSPPPTTPPTAEPSDPTGDDLALARQMPVVDLDTAGLVVAALAVVLGDQLLVEVLGGEVPVAGVEQLTRNANPVRDSPCRLRRCALASRHDVRQDGR